MARGGDPGEELCRVAPGVAAAVAAVESMRTQHLHLVSPRTLSRESLKTLTLKTQQVNFQALPLQVLALEVLHVLDCLDQRPPLLLLLHLLEPEIGLAVAVLT